MEELLNKLIEKGWKPFGYNKGKYSCDNLEINNKTKKMYMAFNSGTPGIFVLQFSLRDICSFESGLWQFVCENGMVENLCTWDKYDEDDVPVPNQQHLGKYYEYRLIESALKDESELEQFLLDNIKV